ncbi:ECF transporter S component [Caldisalinibacter kiritimatiensis]|uniref:ECF transporter S component n=1 Tax=Caldisalinibacter kiritimatiensis TaxID=1304284 RepID=R1AUF7_9FIRM|nr:ECF transporter S component [Caldisalinibacter kiritimatiensis]EOD00287.1 hypothetical protein L21TH_1661 [Caldisalinibacter kiritimatiensis]
MEKSKKTRELITGGLLLALGILLPMIFHSFGILGKVFLPMHIPVLVGGFFLSPYLALIVGIITPLLSGLLTGMPPMYPMAVIMAFELGTYGIIASLAVRKFRLSIVLSLILSMISGRVVAGIVVFILANLFGVQMAPFVFVKGSVVTGLPGIAIQLVLIPALIYSLNTFTKTEMA